MPMIAPLLGAAVARAHSIAAGATTALADRARVQRERTTLLRMDDMNDDLLRDIGLTRDAIRCGLNDPRSPMRAARRCARGTFDAGGLNSARWGRPDRYPRVAAERYLGW